VAALSDSSSCVINATSECDGAADVSASGTTGQGTSYNVSFSLDGSADAEFCGKRMVEAADAPPPPPGLPLFLPPDE
jgi:hypothetical protein